MAKKEKADRRGRLKVAGFGLAVSLAAAVAWEVLVRLLFEKELGASAGWSAGIVVVLLYVTVGGSVLLAYGFVAARARAQADPPPANAEAGWSRDAWALVMLALALSVAASTLVASLPALVELFADRQAPDHGALLAMARFGLLALALILAAFLARPLSRIVYPVRMKTDFLEVRRRELDEAPLAVLTALSRPRPMVLPPGAEARDGDFAALVLKTLKKRIGGCRADKLADEIGMAGDEEMQGGATLGSSPWYLAARLVAEELWSSKRESAWLFVVTSCGGADAETVPYLRDEEGAYRELLKLLAGCIKPDEKVTILEAEEAAELKRIPDGFVVVWDAADFGKSESINGAIEKLIGAFEKMAEREGRSRRLIYDFTAGPATVSVAMPHRAFNSIGNRVSYARIADGTLDWRVYRVFAQGEQHDDPTV